MDIPYITYIKQPTHAKETKMSIEKNYRVADDNSVLAYFPTRYRAENYLLELAENSPKVASKCSIEKKSSDSSWSKTDSSWL